jgi:acetyl esterase/lipase
MIRILLSLSLLAMTVLDLRAAAAPEPLWPGKPPGSLGDGDSHVPTIQFFAADPAKSTGAVMVVCPGGGYGGLADHEGTGYAEWLAGEGVAAVVLRYRVGSDGYRHPVMLNDAARAVRTVRHRAAEWKVNPSMVGIMGSSAGGHLASTVLTRSDPGTPGAEDPVDRLSSRPDFGVLCYAVITMGQHTHGGSKRNLLGDQPSAELIELLSNEKQVTKETPPCFLWHTWEDKAVKVENTLDFASALQRHGVKFDLHVYQKGRHGIGLSRGENGAAPGQVHPWALDLLVWMRANGWVK